MLSPAVVAVSSVFTNVLLKLNHDEACPDSDTESNLTVSAPFDATSTLADPIAPATADRVTFSTAICMSPDRIKSDNKRKDTHIENEENGARAKRKGAYAQLPPSVDDISQSSQSVSFHEMNRSTSPTVASDVAHVSFHAVEHHPRNRPTTLTPSPPLKPSSPGRFQIQALRRTSAASVLNHRRNPTPDPN